MLRTEKQKVQVPKPHKLKPTETPGSWAELYFVVSHSPPIDEKVIPAVIHPSIAMEPWLREVVGWDLKPKLP